MFLVDSHELAENSHYMNTIDTLLTALQASKNLIYHIQIEVFHSLQDC